MSSTPSKSAALTSMRSSNMPKTTSLMACRNMPRRSQARRASRTGCIPGRPPKAPPNAEVPEGIRGCRDRHVDGENHEPYRGYYFRILTEQGPKAQGGRANYLVNGSMMGGFALVAWPAEYGVSGVQTFIVNHDGTVYEKHLGPLIANPVARLPRPR